VGAGEGVTSVEVNVGERIAVLVRVELTGVACKVIVATESVGVLSEIWVEGVEPPVRLQAARIATRKRDIDKNLNVFNLSFMITIDI
jgi:hypothetical protein